MEIFRVVAQEADVRRGVRRIAERGRCARRPRVVATGAYMTHKSWSWSDGWIDSALVAVGVLLVNGAVVVGSRGRRVGRALATGDPAALVLARDPVLHIAPWLNTGLAVGVVFVMATKLSLAGSVASLVVAALIGAGVGAAGLMPRRGLVRR